ncbi:hypothetical protein ILYODFUR_024065 [Ilyodon furcidens]|uniref:Secreted protein n=1 Tax=Ilyodon furcidens TaxID=33524 RepID=A0ABV0U7Y7_9TELE
MQSWQLKLRMAGIVTCLLSCCCYICYHRLHKDERGQEGCLHLKLWITLSDSSRLLEIGTSFPATHYGISGRK